MIEIEIGQKWTHKLTSMNFQVVLIDEEEIMLEPIGDGAELNLSKKLLLQEFNCPAARRMQVNAKNSKKRRIKPGRVRRGARR